MIACHIGHSALYLQCGNTKSVFYPPPVTFLQQIKLPSAFGALSEPPAVEEPAKDVTTGKRYSCKDQPKAEVLDHTDTQAKGRKDDELRGNRQRVADNRVGHGLNQRSAFQLRHSPL